MKNAYPWFMTLLVCVGLVGCETPSRTQTSADGRTIDAAILEISKNRNRAEDSAAETKQRFKAGSPQYAKAQRLYRDARAENNSWLDLLQNKIRNGAKPQKSPDFNEQSKKAAAATESFLHYADSLGQPEGVQAVPVVAAIGAAEIVKMFVENGITIWKVYSEQRQAARERNAKDLDRLRWEGWVAAEAPKSVESPQKATSAKVKAKAKPVDKTKPPQG